MVHLIAKSLGPSEFSGRQNDQGSAHQQRHEAGRHDGGDVRAIRYRHKAQIGQQLREHGEADDAADGITRHSPVLLRFERPFPLHDTMLPIR